MSLARFGTVTHARALDGYLLAAMDSDDEFERAGLGADPGNTGDRVICSFVDLPSFETAQEARYSFVFLEDKWSCYVA